MHRRCTAMGMGFAYMCSACCRMGAHAESCTSGSSSPGGALLAAALRMVPFQPLRSGARHMTQARPFWCLFFLCP